MRRIIDFEKKNSRKYQSFIELSSDDCAKLNYKIVAGEDAHQTGNRKNRTEQPVIRRPVMMGVCVCPFSSFCPAFESRKPSAFPHSFCSTPLARTTRIIYVPSSFSFHIHIDNCKQTIELIFVSAFVTLFNINEFDGSVNMIVTLMDVQSN